MTINSAAVIVLLDAVAAVAEVNNALVVSMGVMVNDWHATMKRMATTIYARHPPLNLLGIVALGAIEETRKSQLFASFFKSFVS